VTSTTERLEILDLLARYCSAIDEHDAGGVRSCFLDDATFDVKAKDPLVAGLRSGPDEITAFISSTWADQVEQPRHFILNVIFDSVTEDTAEVHANLLLTFANDEGAYVAATGTYHTTLARSVGRWRIRTHELTLDGARAPDRSERE
jgi:ketosteroid isomerase-like protein